MPDVMTLKEKSVLVLVLVVIALAALMAPNHAKSEELDATAKISPPEQIADARKMVAEVSAYTSSIEETDDTPGITASGARVSSSSAACPARFAFGTRIRVAGRVYVCEDRMAARYRDGDFFDLWMASRPAALEWGRRSVEVEIL
jgi:3D (Asp-Asp-Asp) domain-containing protein